MDSILKISESKSSNYPEYFKIFLDNCIRQYPDTFFASDYLFAAIYFLILDSGFCPLDLYENFSDLCTDSFDIRKLRIVKYYEKEYIKVWNGLKNVYMVYKIPIRLGQYSCQCEVQAVPSTENNNYLIVNILKKHSNMVRSVCINMKQYLQPNQGDAEYKYTLKNMKELEILVKDEMCNPIRETIMIDEDQGCCAHLLRLPEAIQTKIIYNMRDSPMDIQHLSSTCSYFYSMTKFDSKLWQEMCVAEFSRRALNQSLLELFQYGNDDSTIFKQAFLELKKREQRKLYKTYRFW